MKPKKKEIRKAFHELDAEIHNKQIEPYKQALKDAKTFREVKDLLLNEMDKLIDNTKERREIRKAKIDEIIDLCNEKIKELENK